jgi:three-Cys-motif partner protein
MAHKDHHIKPYDEGTLNKLEIFERYVQTWLPTFIMQSHISEISIVDFFSGLGYDCEGTKGSPIRTMDKIDSFFPILMKNNTIINLYLNEYKVFKFEALKKNCNDYLDNHKRLRKFVRIHYSNKDFNEIYNEIIVKTKNSPSLYIIDQSGIRFTNQENFNSLLSLTQTDFLFFISSSFFKRFSKEEEFAKHLEIKEEDLNENPYNFIHRIVLEKYRSLIPVNSDLKIFPFSIKKGANIYGIIFGSKHILGVDKFLHIAWKKNSINGEADYDIDEDDTKQQLVLNFENPSETKKLTKIESFNEKLEEFVKAKGITTNIELYNFTYSNGHISEHTNNLLRELRRLKKISYPGHTKISWIRVKKNDIVEFKWLDNGK